MTSETPQNELFNTLQQYLQDTDFNHLTAIDQPDLTTLFSNLAGLKSEVKAESRHFKTTLETLTEALAMLKADNQTLRDELSAAAERQQQQRHNDQRTLFLDIIDIYDRLSDGYRTLQNYRPSLSLFNQSKKTDRQFIESFGKGQEITLKRFEQWLQRRQVYPLECVGKPFDPHTMTTLEIGHDPQHKNGTVLEELRKGFLFEKQILRLAEVKVNKL